MNFDKIILYCDIAILLAYIIVILNLWYYILFYILTFKKIKFKKEPKRKNNFCVIIPARNEGSVIENILKSLKKQTYDPDFFKVYVIVEDENDLSVNKCKQFNYNYFVRKDLKNKHTKGFAIQELINSFSKEEKSKIDAYMIFDADNLMDEDYLKRMNVLKENGYQVGFGYRNFTNANKNLSTSCSAVLFDITNSLISKGRCILFKKIMLNGTGYFIDRKIIDDCNGWIFTGLTEDVQLSVYCTYHNIAMGYDENVQYYDEQPENFKIIHKQHIRWIFGFLENRKKFQNKTPDYKSNNKFIYNVCNFEYNACFWPVVSYVILSLIAYIVEIILLITSFFINPNASLNIFLHSIIPFTSLYGLFFISCLHTLISNHKKMHLSFMKAFITLFIYPFFFFDFLSAFFDGLTHKDKRKVWSTIPHKGDIDKTIFKE